VELDGAVSYTDTPSPGPPRGSISSRVQCDLCPSPGPLLQDGGPSGDGLQHQTGQRLHIGERGPKQRARRGQKGILTDGGTLSHLSGCRSQRAREDPNTDNASKKRFNSLLKGLHMESVQQTQTKLERALGRAHTFAYHKIGH